MTDFKVLDISGDVGLTIYGTKMEKLFENAALGLFSLITELGTIEETEVRIVTVASDDEEGLLIKWLNELIFLFDAYGFIPKDYIINYNRTWLHAVMAGSIFDEERHERKLLIKAATYHDLSLKHNYALCEATVMFDI